MEGQLSPGGTQAAFHAEIHAQFVHVDTVDDEVTVSGHFQFVFRVDVGGEAVSGDGKAGNLFSVFVIKLSEL